MNQWSIQILATYTPRIDMDIEIGDTQELSSTSSTAAAQSSTPTDTTTITTARARQEHINMWMMKNDVMAVETVDLRHLLH